jgi:adenylylsulfate kinase
VTNSLLIGRWSPLHDGHKKLIQAILDEGKPVVVAVRDTKISERDPYTAQDRVDMIKDAFGDRVQVIVIPDIAEVVYGRGVGWSVRELHLDPETEKISATVVRKGKDTPQRVGGFVVWFTGLPSSGKSTVADAVAEELRKTREKVERLDGDTTRKIFWPELGFSKEDRDKNIERVISLSQLLVRNNVAVLTAFISPYWDIREKARREIGGFIEVYVKCPLGVCRQRDTRGMYRQAMEGTITNFTGISAPYEEPRNPDLVIETDIETVEESARKVLNKIRELGYI